MAKKTTRRAPDQTQGGRSTPPPDAPSVPAAASPDKPDAAPATAPSAPRRRQRQPNLRWYRARQCWRYRVTIGGKEHVFYVGKHATGPHDELAKADAIREAATCLERAEHESRFRDVVKLSSRGLRLIEKEVNELHAFFQQPYKTIIDRMYIHEDVPMILRDAVEGELRKGEVMALRERIEELEAMLAAHGRAAVTDATAPLADLKIKWIDSVRNEKKSSGQNSNYIGSFKTNIEPFIDFLAEHAPPILLTRDLEANWRAVADYREHVIETANEKDLSKAWSKHRLDKVRLFCEYLVKNAYLSMLPRAIDRHWSRVGVDDPSPTYLSIDEIHKIWDAADDRLRLVIALGLNAGYRQADLLTLERGEIDIDKGEIRRQRRKRNTAQAHKLWPVTARLLKAHLKAVPDGRPFGTGYSNISRELTTFVDKVLTKKKNIDPRRTAKSFRSTGAQELERIVLGVAPHVVDQYLAHGDKKLARHYREQELAALYEALDKLGEHFNLEGPRKGKSKRTATRPAPDA